MKQTERQFVRMLARQAARHARSARASGFLGLRAGIGDDCAVLAASTRFDLLVTTDLLIEEVHFRRRWQSAESLGHKTLARGLSDIAAMGGVPRYAFLSLAVPGTLPDAWAEEFLRGLLHLAREHRVVLAGGDTSASPQIIADIMVVGQAPRGQAVLRSSAQPGDEIWVSGRLGGAARALATFRRGEDKAADPELLEPLLLPQPRLRMGALLRRRKLASAMIDLSDGLSIDLARLCEQSAAGARIDQNLIPRAPHATLAQALHGGEDFELLFTVPPERARLVPSAVDGVPLTRIGDVVAGKKLRLLSGDTEKLLPALGFQHF